MKNYRAILQQWWSEGSLQRENEVYKKRVKVYKCKFTNTCLQMQKFTNTSSQMQNSTNASLQTHIHKHNTITVYEYIKNINHYLLSLPNKHGTYHVDYFQ